MPVTALPVVIVTACPVTSNCKVGMVTILFPKHSDAFVVIVYDVYRSAKYLSHFLGKGQFSKTFMTRHGSSFANNNVFIAPVYTVPMPSTGVHRLLYSIALLETKIVNALLFVVQGISTWAYRYVETYISTCNTKQVQVDYKDKDKNSI